MKKDELLSLIEGWLLSYKLCLDNGCEKQDAESCISGLLEYIQVLKVHETTDNSK